MVRQYKGGVLAIAGRLGKASETLDKELRGCKGFKLGLDDAAEISAMCHEQGVPEALALLTAWAGSMDCFVLPFEPRAELGADECLRALADASREMHELMSEVMSALADGTVSDNELARIDREAGHLINAVQQLRQVVVARNKAGKPEGEA